MSTVVPSPFLLVGDLYAQPPLMLLWPTFGSGVCGMSETTTYHLAAQDRLPVETVRLGRKRYVRTADVLAWLHLPENDDAAAAVTATASSENASKSAAKQTGATS
ncbi:helix-turn-helix domain-containing protein [Streptomyces liangshanensis]|uniref:helix-turn-helix domain-containing protein n=1 Tax=Streptomyces liangshanensis TaxID=2717324 RepID=UPI0036D914D7